MPARGSGFACVHVLGERKFSWPPDENAEPQSAGGARSYGCDSHALAYAEFARVRDGR
jgi:hypothetical protein